MKQTLAGIQENHSRLTVCALQVTNNHELAECFTLLQDALDCAASLVLKEMFSTRSEFIYWQKLSRSSQWEILLTQWNSRVYRTLTLQPELPLASMLENQQDMVNHIEALRTDFQELSILLSKLHVCASFLKSVYVVAHESCVFHEKHAFTAMADVTNAVLLDTMTVTRPVYFKELSLKNMEAAVKALTQSLQEHLPDVFSETGLSLAPSGQRSGSFTVHLLHEHCHSLSEIMHSVVTQRAKDVSLPSCLVHGAVGLHASLARSNPLTH
jgi:hypothetical protein